MSDNSNGQFTPDDLEDKWDQWNANRVIAQRQIKALELDIDGETKTLTPEEKKKEKAQKKARVVRQKRIQAMHKAELEKLEETVGERLARLNKSKPKKEDSVKEAIRKHNEKLPKNSLI